MLTAQEVAKRAGVSVSALMNMVRNGEHPPADIVTSSGRYWSAAAPVQRADPPPKTRERKEVKPSVRPV